MLGLVRGLAKIGLRSIVLDCSHSEVFYSKHSVGIKCPDPLKDEEAFSEFLCDIGKKLDQKGIVWATSDASLIPLCKHRKSIEKYFIIPTSSWDVIKRCVNKTDLYKIAADAGISIPETFFFKSTEEAMLKYEEILYPCILKPSMPYDFAKTSVPGRVFAANNYQQFEDIIGILEKAGLNNLPLIVQEFIPGGPENLYTLTAYSNGCGEVMAYSTGHKIRQFPPHTGTIVSGRVTPCLPVVELGIKLIKILGFHGICNVEFKKENQTGKFKLMEINPRPGLWNYSATASGVNLIAIAYFDAIGLPETLKSNSNEELIWLRLWDDIFLALGGYAKRGFPEEVISLNEWWRSISGKKVFATFDICDPLPGLIQTYRFFKGQRTNIISILISLFKKMFGNGV